MDGRHTLDLTHSVLYMYIIRISIAKLVKLRVMLQTEKN